MNVSSPQILALDFDGVICDGLAEYFQSTKEAYLRIWPSLSSSDLDSFREAFYHLRPVIETGWEMIILLRVLVLAVPEEEIIEHWSELVKFQLRENNFDSHFLSNSLDQVRDQWIATNLEEWLSLHCFYSGIIERLKSIQQSDTSLYIITTKEGRFVEKLLAEQGLLLKPNQIFGKEVRQPKYQTLQALLKEHQTEPRSLWFVEDLLKTLQKVQQQRSLIGMGLFLADWGYNTAANRDSLSNQSEIKLLSLSQFAQDFLDW